MLCSLLLRSEHGHAHGRLFNWSEGVFDAARNGYVKSLRWVLQYSGIVLLFATVLANVTDGWLALGFALLSVVLGLCLLAEWALDRWQR